MRVPSVHERLLSLSPARRSPGAGTRSAGVTMTKAGSKGGNLRDKLDGNELDLSLSDLNEVPVKELVSTVPRGPRRRSSTGAGPWWGGGSPSFPSFSFNGLKRGGGSGTKSSGRPRPAPAFFLGCTRVTLAQVQKMGG